MGIIRKTLRHVKRSFSLIYHTDCTVYVVGVEGRGSNSTQEEGGTELGCRTETTARAQSRPRTWTGGRTRKGPRTEGSPAKILGGRAGLI